MGQDFGEGRDRIGVHVGQRPVRSVVGPTTVMIVDAMDMMRIRIGFDKAG
jgi:hypothetical protein